MLYNKSILFIVVGAFALASGCTPDRQEPVEGIDSTRADLEPAPSVVRSDTTGTAAVFDCPGFRFTVRPVGDSLAVWLPQQFDRPFLWLPRAAAASGNRYEAEGVVVWTREAEARLEIGGEVFEGCEKDHYASVWEEAKLSGVDFRAVGNEPGWVIDLYGDGRMHLRMDYGENEFSVPTPVPEESDSTAVYHAVTDSHDVRLTISRDGCIDSMSGKAFESTVVAVVDGRTYRGCGRPLH